MSLTGVPGPREPIRRPCEGSGHPPNMKLTGPIGLCAMCGTTQTTVDGKVVDHDRDDIEAMIERGDFGGR